jgi:hypothetical protein
LHGVASRCIVLRGVVWGCIVLCGVAWCCVRQYDPPKGWAEQEGPAASDAELSDLASAAAELQALVCVTAVVRVIDRVHAIWLPRVDVVCALLYGTRFGVAGLRGPPLPPLGPCLPRASPGLTGRSGWCHPLGWTAGDLYVGVSQPVLPIWNPPSPCFPFGPGPSTWTLVAFTGSGPRPRHRCCNPWYRF